MNANKMTQKTLETLQQAQSLAEERRNTQVGQIHVFHALLDDPDDLNAQLMASMGISTDELRAAIDTELDKQATFGSSGGQVYMTPELNSVLTRAEEEAKRNEKGIVEIKSEQAFQKLMVRFMEKLSELDAKIETFAESELKPYLER